jgi:group I intron endonuclease
MRVNRKKLTDCYGVIYKTTNLINNKIYIGQTTYNCPIYYGSGKLLISAIEKYRVKFFKREILEKCYSKEELNYAEKKYINLLNSDKRGVGYNLCEGGNGGKTLPEPWNKGKKLPKLSDEHKNKISKACKGLKRSEEAKRNISLSLQREKHPMFGKYHSEKTRNKMSLSKTGEKNPRFGKYVEDYTKKKISESLKKRGTK